MKKVRGMEDGRWKLKEVLFLPLLFSFLTLSLNSYSQCLSGNCINGYGSYQYGKGTIFTGYFKDSRRNGIGKTTYSSGASYEGGYLNDLPDGLGTFIWVGGKKYSGEWKHGNYNGVGNMHYMNGTKDSGLWQNNKLVKVYFSDRGTKAEGPYKPEFPDGKCTLQQILFFEGNDTNTVYRLGYNSKKQIDRIKFVKDGKIKELSIVYSRKGWAEKLNESALDKPAVVIEYNEIGEPLKRTSYGSEISYTAYTSDKNGHLAEATDYSQTGSGFKMTGYTTFKFDSSGNLLQSRYYLFDDQTHTLHLESTRTYELGKEDNPLYGLMILFGANELTLSPKVIYKKNVTLRDNTINEIPDFSLMVKGYLTEVRDVCKLVYECK